jgi:hypothetical protein
VLTNVKVPSLVGLVGADLFYDSAKDEVANR